MVVVVVVVVMVVVVVSDHFAASWIQKVKSKICVCMLPTFLSIFVKFLLAEGRGGVVGDRCYRMVVGCLLLFCISTAFTLMRHCLLKLF